MTFVRGEKDVAYLKKRYEALKEEPLFAGIEYSEDSRVINKWAPLLMQKRRKGEPFAATRVPAGTDVDFGALTRQLFDAPRATTARTCAPTPRSAASSGTTTAPGVSSTAARSAAPPATIRAKFVFVGAGGWALKLLQQLRHPRDHGLRRLPDRRAVPQDDEPRARRPAPGEGVLAGVGRRAADVGAAPRHPRRRRRGVACCSGRSPGSARSSSRTARSSTSSRRSVRATCGR